MVRSTLGAFAAGWLFIQPADTAHGAAERQDVVIIGAGIAGLSAALESARRGASVLVVDMSTVGGGHAILSNGAVCLVGTPLQASKGIADSAVLAAKDFIARGEDNDMRWVSAYVRDSKRELYDWLTELGVAFDNLVRPPGNSVPRLHLARGKGLGLVEPIYRACLRHPGIKFLWAASADELIVRDGRVIGVQVRELRTRVRRPLMARHIIVATGGFQSNLERVMNGWPADLPKPSRLLLGAAHTATGSGHDLAVRVGATMSRLDHQWNYVLGFPDPRDPDGRRGLAAFNFSSIWVNSEGKRFTPELGDEKVNLRAVLEQPQGSYWSVFDEKGKGGFSVTLAGWENVAEVGRLVYETRGAVVRAGSLEELATAIRVPPQNLTATVARYNSLAVRGRDVDFDSFGDATSPKPKPIDTPPFYAAQFFPITRKSMGGIDVDRDCRVLDKSRRPIPGLYAVGEVTGFGGINGKAALEGTFLGPAIYMGRIAGRHVAGQVTARPTFQQKAIAVLSATTFDDAQCLGCHDVGKDVVTPRAGYWHYEQSHAKAVARGYRCSLCHGDQFPYRAASHRLDRTAIVARCVTCHGVQSRDAQAAIPQHPET